MMRILFIAFASLLGILSAGAQSKTTLLQRINEIKSQTDVYFWDQYTHPNADTAKVYAAKRLLVDINLNRPEQERVTVDEVLPCASFISMDRGKLKQVFAYIKQDVAMQLRKGMSAPQPIVTPMSDETGTQRINVEKPLVKTFVPDAFTQRIVATRRFLDVYNLLKSFQADGRILQFGKLKDIEDYSSLDLILFDMQSGELVTMLSAADRNGKRINMVSGVEDSLDNYPPKMTAVIWYIKK